MKRTILLLPIIMLAIASSASAQVVEVEYPEPQITSVCWHHDKSAAIQKDYLTFTAVWDMAWFDALGFDIQHSQLRSNMRIQTEWGTEFTDWFYPIQPGYEPVSTGIYRMTWQGYTFIPDAYWTFFSSTEMQFQSADIVKYNGDAFGVYVHPLPNPDWSNEAVWNLNIDVYDKRNYWLGDVPECIYYPGLSPRNYEPALARASLESALNYPTRPPQAGSGDGYPAPPVFGGG